MNSLQATHLALTAVFLLCLLTLGIGALIAVMSTRLIRSVCGLAICCIGLAGLYYFLHSPFLALMELLIYVGAVCVTIVFAIMLAEPEEPAREQRFGSALVWGGFALTAPTELANDGSLAAIGRALLTTYSLAFELISLALLVAILGALAIARHGRAKA